MIHLKFGLWQAAFLFKETGQDIYKILNILGLSVSQWNYYTTNYSYFFQLDRKGLGSLTVFGIKPANDKLKEFLSYFEEEFLPLRTEEDTLAIFSRRVRDKIFLNPHIGIFKSMTWQAVYIADHSRIGPCMYTHDYHYVYCCGEKLKDSKGNMLEGVIADKFHILSTHYMSDGINIYGEQKKKAKHDLTSTFSLLKKIDIASFRPIGLYYGADNNAVYFHTNKRVASQSALQLKPVKQLFFNYKKEPLYKDSEYAIDDENIYYKGKIISNQPKHLQQINDSHYYTDGQVLFHQGKTIPEVDLESFRTDDPHIKSSDYGYDKNNKYFGSKSYPLANKEDS